jgi:hypothetical protein
MKQVYIFGLVLIMGAVVSSELSAGDLTIYTGFQNPGKLTVDNITRDTKLGSVIGARISAGRVVGFEQTFAYSPTFLESGHHAFNTQSNLLLGVPVGHFIPYGTAGVGLVATGSGSFFAFEDIGTKFTINYGGGIKFRNLAGPVGIRFDVRGYTVPKVFDQTLNFIEGTVGIVLSW